MSIYGFYFKEDDGNAYVGENAPEAEAEEGEIDDLEDGEVKDEDDARQAVGSPPEKFSGGGPAESVTSPTGGRKPSGQLPPSESLRPEDVGLCKFFLRGSCTWGNTCKFVHPGGSGERGNYRMFPDVPPPPPGPLPPLMRMRGPPIPPGFRQRGPPGFGPRGGPPRFPPPGPLFPPMGGPPAQVEDSEESAWEKGLKRAREVGYFFSNIIYLGIILFLF